MSLASLSLVALAPRLLLYDMLLRAGAIGPSEAKHYQQMIDAAAGYIVRNGPATQQDRWEGDGAYSLFTLAVEIAALSAAADAKEVACKSSVAHHLREPPTAGMSRSTPGPTQPTPNFLANSGSTVTICGSDLRAATERLRRGA